MKPCTLFKNCVCVYMFRHTSVQMHVHICSWTRGGQRQPRVFPQGPFIWIFHVASHWPGVRQWRYAGWPVNPRGLPVAASHALGLLPTQVQGRIKTQVLVPATQALYQARPHGTVTSAGCPASPDGNAKRCSTVPTPALCLQRTLTFRKRALTRCSGDSSCDL